MFIKVRDAEGRAHLVNAGAGPIHSLSPATLPDRWVIFFHGTDTVMLNSTGVRDFLNGLLQAGVLEGSVYEYFMNSLPPTISVLDTNGP
jgi:hypothetical protein